MRYPFAAVLLLMTACRGGSAVRGDAEAGATLDGAADGGPLDGATSPICLETSEAASTCASDAPDLVYPRPYSCAGGAKPATSEECKELAPTGGDAAFCCDRPRVEWPVATIDVDGGEIAVPDGVAVAITAPTPGAWRLSFSCSQSSGADPCSIAVKVHAELGGIGDPLDITGDIGSLTQARSSSDTVSLELVKPGAATASLKTAPDATLEMTGLVNGKRVHGLFFFVHGKKITTDAEFTNPLRIRMEQPLRAGVPAGHHGLRRRQRLPRRRSCHPRRVPIAGQKDLGSLSPRRVAVSAGLHGADYPISCSNSRSARGVSVRTA